jgi:hypothetical protein
MKRGPFVALSATFPDDKDIVRAGERAAWLYLVMACDSRLHRGDGIVEEHRMTRLAVPGWRTRLTALIDNGLVQQVPEGYYLPGYLKWNQSEHAYQKRSAAGKVAACKKHHTNCEREDCAEARYWLKVNGYADG